MYTIKKLYCEKHSVKNAIVTGDLETLKTINEYFPIKRKSEYTYLAAEYGHLEILKYLHNNISIPINDQTKTIQTTLNNGHTHIAEYIVFVGHITEDYLVYYQNIMSDGIWKKNKYKR
jgi:hypothetical protein